MPKNLADWKSIKDEKEKYNAYLCSREWAEKREAVRNRSDGKCERCYILNMDACHHLTYVRKYNESLDDLQAICKHCHEFLHGKCWFDPKRNIGVLCYALQCIEKQQNPAPFVLLVNGIHVLKTELFIVCELIDAIHQKGRTISTWSDKYDVEAELITFEVCMSVSCKFLPFNYAGLLRFCKNYLSWTGDRLEAYSHVLDVLNLKTDELLVIGEEDL